MRRFTITWLVILALAVLVILTGVDPVKLTEYAVILSVVIMPLTYLPVLIVSSRRSVMGQNTISTPLRWASWAFFGIIVLVVLAAIPLMIITRMGQA